MVLAIRAKYSAGKLFGTSKHEKVLNTFYDSGSAKLCPPDNSAHISSHNAVKINNSDAIRQRVYLSLRARHDLALDDAYKKACKRAAAKGRPVPVRDQYLYGGWGYPYAMGMPFMAMPMGYGYYAGDPCMMNTGAGMAGACAAGTCSGGVAAGGW